MVICPAHSALLAPPEAIALPVSHIPPTLVAEDGGVAIGSAVILARHGGDVLLDGLLPARPAGGAGWAVRL